MLMSFATFLAFTSFDRSHSMVLTYIRSYMKLLVGLAYFVYDGMSNVFAALKMSIICLIFADILMFGDGS